MSAHQRHRNGHTHAAAQAGRRSVLARLTDTGGPQMLPSPYLGSRPGRRALAAGPAAQLLDVIGIPEDAARIPRTILKAIMAAAASLPQSSRLAPPQWPRW